VRGLSFRMVSTSVITVSSCFKLINVLPEVFFTARLLKPMICSQNPPYPGAHLRINCQLIFWDSRAFFSSSELNILCNSSAAAKYVEALSEIILRGTDFWLQNRQNAYKKVSTMRLVTTSRCTAHVTTHENKQIYTLVSSLLHIQCSREVDSSDCKRWGLHDMNLG